MIEETGVHIVSLTVKIQAFPFLMSHLSGGPTISVLKSCERKLCVRNGDPIFRNALVMKGPFINLRTLTMSNIPS